MSKILKNTFVKSTLITLLLVIQYLLIFLPFLYLQNIFIENKEHEALTAMFLSLLSWWISYFIVFKFILKLKFSSININTKTKSLKLDVIFVILLISIGIVIINRPLWDINRIDFFLKENTVSVDNHPFTGFNAQFFLNLISVLIVAPLTEELLFRKYMFTGVLKNNSFVVSAIFSSVLFALLHLPNYTNLIPTFILGFISCIIYFRTKNILYSILIHFFYNLIIQIISDYNYNSFYNFIYKLEFNYMYWLIVLFGVVLTFFSLKRLKKSAKLKDEPYHHE